MPVLNEATGLVAGENIAQLVRDFHSGDDDYHLLLRAAVEAAKLAGKPSMAPNLSAAPQPIAAGSYDAGKQENNYRRNAFTGGPRPVLGKLGQITE